MVLSADSGRPGGQENAFDDQQLQKDPGLEGYGLSMVERVPIEVQVKLKTSAI